MGEQPDDYKKNFAMLIPQHAIHLLHGCNVYGATSQEFDDFTDWFEGHNYKRLQLNGMNLDMWIRYNDMVIDSVGYPIQELFKQWKQNPPKTGYGFSSFEIKE